MTKHGVSSFNVWIEFFADMARHVPTKITRKAHHVYEYTLRHLYIAHHVNTFQ